MKLSRFYLYRAGRLTLAINYNGKSGLWPESAAAAASFKDRIALLKKKKKKFILVGLMLRSDVMTDFQS